MITIGKKKYEKLVTELIYTRDIRQLLTMYSLDKIFYFSILKDLSAGRNSPNYRTLRSIARSKNLDESFIVQQAKSVLDFYVPFYQTGSPEYYDILNVRKDATEEEIRKSWIELMKSHHPDKAGSEGLDRTKKINEAYQVLKDNRKRDAYDRKHLPYIPVLVSDGGFPENLYYAVPAILIAIAVLAYVAGSGWVLKSDEAQKKSSGVIEDTVRFEDVTSNAVPDTNTAASGMKLPEAGQPADPMMAEVEDSRGKTGTGAEVEPDTKSDEPGYEKPTDAGDGNRSRSLASEKHPDGERDTSHGRALTESKLDAEDVETVNADEEATEKLEAASGRDGGVQKDDKAVGGTVVSEKEAEASVTRDDKGESLHEAGVKQAEEETEAVQKIEGGEDVAEKEGREAVGEAAIYESGEDKKQTVLAGFKTEPPGKKEAGVKKTESEKVRKVGPDTLYTVQQGDSLWIIAHKFDTTTSELIRLNNLSDNRLHAGDELIVQGKGLPAPSVHELAEKKAAGIKNDSGQKKIETARVTEKKNAPEAAAQAEGMQHADRLPVPESKALENTQKQQSGPDANSLSVFVSEYVSAYKNGDISKLQSLFSPDAVENGVSITKVLGAYRSNFETMEVITYDVKINQSRIINSTGTVTGDFFVRFRDRRTGLTKNSRGRIDWRLGWSDGAWKIAELSYKIQKTDTAGRW